MALSFPINPTLGQTYTFGNKTWVWTGSAWKIQDVGAINGITIGNTTPAAGTFSDLTVTTTTDLGNVANITILGGTSGQVLSTDGTGNLSWSDGGAGPGGATTVAVDNFVGDGETATFTLTVTPQSKDWITVNINGVLQLEDAYEVSGTTLTLDSAPPLGVSIDVRTVRFGSEFVSDATTITINNFTGNGVANSFVLTTTPSSKDWITVNYNGVIQQSNAYSLSGNTVTFADTPANTSEIEIRTVKFGDTLLAPSVLAVSGPGDVEVGNVTGLNFTGSGVTVTGSGANATIDINTSTANTAVTVTGNAQGNITSVGTLTSLNVAGNVGIGTSSPGSRLTVASPETTSITAETINNPVAVALSATYMDSGGYGYGSVGTTTNHGFEFQQNGIPRMILTPTGNIGVLNANVGINQFAPTELLDVGGNVRAQGFVGNGPLNLSAAGANAIVFNSNSIERVRIDNAGNVGIGTSSPGQRLTVAGAGQFGSGTTASSGSLSLRIGVFNAVPTDATDAFVGVTNTGGPGGLAGDLFLVPRTSTGVSNGISFLTGSTTPSERMRITSGGNVGIGTSSPSGASGRVLEINGGTGQARLVLKNDTTGSGSADGAQIALVSDALVIQNRENSYISIETNGDERMRIDSSGRLLVGTTTGTQGRIRSNDNSGGAGQLNFPLTLINPVPTSFNTAAVVAFEAASGVYSYIGARTDTGSAGSNGQALVFATNLSGAGPTERMRISSSGNMGIGLSSPSARLDVFGSTIQRSLGDGYVRFASFNGVDPFGANYDRYEERFDTGSQVYLVGTANGGSGSPRALGFVTAGSERMRINTDGNLLLGTTSAGAAGITVGDGRTYNFLGTGNSQINNYRSSNIELVQRVAGYGIDFYVDAGSLAGRFGSGGQLQLTGQLFINRTTLVSGYASYVNISHSGGSIFGIMLQNTSSSVSNALSFINSGGAAVGAVQVSSSVTSYITSSDYRLKEDITPMTGALARVAALRPVTYRWKVDGSSGEGFVAHELAEVCPQAVTGEKDAVDAKGNPLYQGIDTSFLVATLTAAIQEQQAQFQALRAEFDAYRASHP